MTDYPLTGDPESTATALRAIARAEAYRFYSLPSREFQRMKLHRLAQEIGVEISDEPG